MSRYRHEYKYLIDARQESILLLKTAGVALHDPHVGKDGSYLIHSVYFDDLFDSCLQESIGGKNPRAKYRIRYYNHDTDLIMFEKKFKMGNMTLKKSCRISREECEILLRGEIPELSTDLSEDKVEIFSEVMIRGLVPKVIVTYERIPYVYSGGNVRITFDRKISSSNETARFLTGDYMTRPILPIGQTVLEVKWDEVLPRHIKEVMTLENLQWTAFSKYYTCRMIHL